jgi:hypothetical protein
MRVPYLRALSALVILLIAGSASAVTMEWTIRRQPRKRLRVSVRWLLWALLATSNTSAPTRSPTPSTPSS